MSETLNETPSEPAPQQPSDQLPRDQQTGSMWSAIFRLDRAFWFANLVFTLDGAAYFGILNLLTLYLGTAVGMSDRTAGTSVSLFSVSVTLSNALLGGLADRLGPRRAITYSALVSLAGRVLLSLAPGLVGAKWWAWAALAIMGAAQGVLIPACYTAVKKSTTERTSAIGFALLYAFQNVGALFEGMVSPFVRKHYGMTSTMWMCAGLTGVYIVAHVLGYPREKDPPRGSALAPRIASDERESGGVDAPKDKALDSSLLNPRFLYFIFILLGVRTLFVHQFLTLNAYVVRAYPADVGDKLEWVLSINPLIVLVFTPLIAAFTSRVDVVKMMILGTFISASATFLLVPGPNLTALLAYSVIFSFGEAIWSSRFLEYVANIAPPNKVGVYMGFAQIPWVMAKFTTGLYSGAMLQWLCPATGPQNTQLLWLIYALIGVTSPIGLLVARKWLASGSMTHARAAAT